MSLKLKLPASSLRDFEIEYCNDINCTNKITRNIDKLDLAEKDEFFTIPGPFHNLDSSVLKISKLAFAADKGGGETRKYQLSMPRAKAWDLNKVHALSSTSDPPADVGPKDQTWIVILLYVLLYFIIGIFVGVSSKKYVQVVSWPYSLMRLVLV